MNVLLYLIVFLHQTTTSLSLWLPRCTLYLIVFLHQTTTVVDVKLYWIYCILSSFYIKPQPALVLALASMIVSYRLSTSNHNWTWSGHRGHTIVSYRLSTSNHNCLLLLLLMQHIVSYRLSTSNHNPLLERGASYGLYLIVFLHQTTTLYRQRRHHISLYLIVFLHQTNFDVTY